MQIHELNTFSGKPGELDFLAIDSGFDTSKISAARFLETKVNQPKDEHNQYTNGDPGQLLRTNGDGSTEWSDVGLPTDEQTAQAVNDWLDNHPEATTTVLDGSLTEAKFSDPLKLKAIKDYVTPQMFGAKGDGVADDTDAIQDAIDSGYPVYVPSGIYCVTAPLTAKGRLQMEMAELAEIVVAGESTIEYLIGIKNDGGAYANTFGDRIAGGILNGNNKCNVIVGMNYTVQGTLDSVNIKGFLQKGVYIRHNIQNANVGSGSCVIRNCRIENDSPVDNTYGIYDAGGDNVFDTLVVKDANIGMVVNGGSIAKSCHIWQSDDTYFDTSCAFLLRGQLGALSDCVSDTMRYGVKTDANYVKYSLSNFIYYFNTDVTPQAYLDSHQPIVFDFYSDRQQFAIANLNANLANAMGKIVSDNAIGIQSIKFVNTNLNGMDNAISANTPSDIVVKDFSKMLEFSVHNSNITNADIDGQLTTNIMGGYIVYTPNYQGWGIVITIQNAENTVQTLCIAGSGAVTRRYSSGSWNSFS